MRTTNPLAIIGIAVIALGTAQCRNPEQLVPKRIVGMDYPQLASRARIEGRVEVTCRIDQDGSVASIETPGNPNPLLSKPAQENAKRWIFAKSADRSRSTGTITLMYYFKMEGKGSDHPRSQFVFECPNSIYVTSEFWNLNTATTPEAGR